MPGTFKEFICWPLYKLVDFVEHRQRERERWIRENGCSTFGIIVESKPYSDADGDPGYKYVIEFFTADGTRKRLKSEISFHCILEETYRKYGKVYGIGTLAEVTYLPTRPSRNLHKVLPKTTPN